MNFDDTRAKMQDLKRRARSARRRGQHAEARVFASGAARFQRRLGRMVKPETPSAQDSDAQ